MFFFNSTTNAVMQKALEATWQRAELINHNIANEDTPGFKAKRLSFESMLSNEISRLQKASGSERKRALEDLEELEPVVYTDKSVITRADENNVDILAEQAELARNTLWNQALTQRVSSYYSTLQYAISGGQ